MVLLNSRSRTTRRTDITTSDDGPPTPDTAPRRALVLSRDEVATVLAALDVSEGLADRSDEPLVRRAIRLLTSTLWPELGDLLGDDEQYN